MSGIDDHGGERQAVAAQLQEFLEQHRAGAPRESGRVRRAPPLEIVLARSISSMNTSSSVGWAGCHS